MTIHGARLRATHLGKRPVWEGMDAAHRLPHPGSATTRSPATSSTTAHKVFEVEADPLRVPTMPMEYSVAAFRFGHSMIRGEHDWNAEFPNGQGDLFSSTCPGPRVSRRRSAGPAEQLDRRLAAALPLLEHRPGRPQAAAR